MATYSNTLTWRILWTEEPDGLQCMGSQRVGLNLGTEQQQMLILLHSNISEAHISMIHFQPDTVFRNKALALTFCL